MKINFELTKQDYIDFNLFHLDHSKTGRKTLFIQRYIVSLIFILAPFVLRWITEIPFSYWMVVCLAAYILWVINYPKSLKKSVVKRIDKMLSEGKNTSLIGDNDIVINEGCITRITKQSESKSAWDTIESVQQNQKNIYIYNSALSAYIIPKRAFENKEDEASFINQVKAYIKNYEA